MTQSTCESSKDECSRDLPFPRLLIAINRIIDISIPFELKNIERHKQLIERYRQNQEWDHLLKEQINGLQSVQRLKANLRELEVLGQQMIQKDQQLVYQKIIPIKTTVCSVVQDFIDSNEDLRNPLIGLDVNNDRNYCEDNQNSNCGQNEEKNSNLQLMVEIQEQSLTLNSWQTLRHELKDLNEMFNTIVSTLMGQKERVNAIEDNIGSAHEDVVFGTQHLSKASALKSTFVPITAGLLSGAVFGPIGMLAGFKFAGVVTAVGASIVGFTGMKVIQNKSISTEETDLVESEEQKISQKKCE